MRHAPIVAVSCDSRSHAWTRLRRDRETARCRATADQRERVLAIWDPLVRAYGTGALAAWLSECAAILRGMTVEQVAIKDLSHDHIGGMLGVASAVSNKRTLMIGLLVSVEHFVRGGDKVETELTLQVAEDQTIVLPVKRGVGIYRGDSANDIVAHLATLSPGQ